MNKLIVVQFVFTLEKSISRKHRAIYAHEKRKNIYVELEEFSASTRAIVQRTWQFKH